MGSGDGELVTCGRGGESCTGNTFIDSGDTYPGVEVIIDQATLDQFRSGRVLVMKLFPLGPFRIHRLAEAKLVRVARDTEGVCTARYRLEPIDMAA